VLRNGAEIKPEIFSGVVTKTKPFILANGATRDYFASYDQPPVISLAHFPALIV
jgi:hypothetical protein